ncbi:tyrosine-type recombinase/integrase [Porphyrobacter sp. LM 6]|uniref:tyrosine-type recombinase/integrase n=1 Tax=Porphyrobacter sp. LM 6 TaxID=1896196 RepID=UPI00084751F5|nr:tyrosine-type recombinase/integrase [Porphyrobacter sp. LM 6]AOL93016.1 Site-specific recombinase XerD [Porphyrobacter sp. LM 6]
MLDEATAKDFPDWRAEFKRLEGAFAPGTIKSYLTDVERFVAWCEEHGLRALPAEAETVCAFLEGQAVILCPSSVRRRLYAIRKVHRLLRLPDPTWGEDISITLRRVQRAKLSRPKQAKGMTRDYLEQCLAAQPDNPWGLRNRAMLSLGYDLLTRRSELVALRSEDIAMRADGTLRAIIRRSKADPFGMGRISFSSRRSAALVSAWLAWRGDKIDPLFCGIYQGKPINRALGTTKVKLIIKEAVAAAGLPPDEVAGFSGHSLRVGAAQDLLCAGFDTAAIMRAGGWKSVNVLGRYLEFAEHNVWA